MQWKAAPLVLLLLGLLAPSLASNLIADSVFQSHASTGRNLLQAKKACPLSFEFMNYTIIANQCKGPEYPPDRCRSSFKEFACPYTDMMNDLTNECASTMLSYINLYRRYPAGLFASACREGKEGLACPPTSSQADFKEWSHHPCSFFSAKTRSCHDAAVI